MGRKKPVLVMMGNEFDAIRHFHLSMMMMMRGLNESVAKESCSASITGIKKGDAKILTSTSKRNFCKQTLTKGAQVREGELCFLKPLVSRSQVIHFSSPHT